MVIGVVYTKNIIIIINAIIVGNKLAIKQPFAYLGLVDIFIANIIIPTNGIKKHITLTPVEAVSLLFLFFAPQLGQVVAFSEISFQHSLHFISAILLHLLLYF